MINNGGGMFDEEGNADCLYDRNVEAVDYLLELVKGGYVDPGSASYIDTDVYTELKNGRAGMALANATIPQETGTDPVHRPLRGDEPDQGAHGDMGTIQYLKNYQMYTKTPSMAGSEKFLLWWNELFVGKKGFFAQGITAAVPVRKSVIALPEVQADPQLVEDHQRVGAGGQARVRPLRAHLLRPGHRRQRHGHGPVHPVDPEGKTTATAALRPCKTGSRTTAPPTRRDRRSQCRAPSGQLCSAGPPARSPRDGPLGTRLK